MRADSKKVNGWNHVFWLQIKVKKHRLAGLDPFCPCLIKVNLRELEALAGQDLEDEQDQEQLARRIVEEGKSQVVVVSLGAAGVLMSWEEGWERIRAPTGPIKSKVGAGDSTVAGIVVGLERGMAASEAVRFGVAAGAAAVMTPGTEPCRREDTERLYERISEKRMG